MAMYTNNPTRLANWETERMGRVSAIRVDWVRRNGVLVRSCLSRSMGTDALRRAVRSAHGACGLRMRSYELPAVTAREDEEDEERELCLDGPADQIVLPPVGEKLRCFRGSDHLRALPHEAPFNPITGDPVGTAGMLRNTRTPTWMRTSTAHAAYRLPKLGFDRTQPKVRDDYPRSRANNEGNVRMYQLPNGTWGVEAYR
eukprot:CAMPEP_0182935576 /NCGR_PEP_ID=MMETSP0105_2-20130417/38431_1 /TAXON_ID=81532 ORGANISM="Acanthoeca-like sp., Strain 10tr" /NCGR_SAMPLE_ID=MMETSP0105_2 /ASSEMBLY_ACC=CAM_ASM_000205 /LENGTH=199 /DNA_ID=CAMNT_0025074569 /DNA_START=16 /DNA_END=615 /DNA_ORIENTATION=+